VRPLPGILSLLLALSATGCGRIDRTRQCIDLIATVNTALDEIAAQRDAGAGSADTERALAKRYTALAAELEAKQFGNPGLAKAVLEYRDFLRDTARLLDRVAAARDRRDSVGLSNTKRELANLGRREKMLTMRIDASCQSP
jgi:hypothetical protein